MENQKTSIMKVRWCLRFKGPFGWDYVWKKDRNGKVIGIRYWDSFSEFSKSVTERIDANPEMQFEILKETYYVKA